ncbi:maltose ABC transporter permease MalF [Rubrivivax rivuli]|uniref:Maltose/maltodextrin transport system permease protein n=1 Tax=Rubrivivax rivuli TaxID=1862385 RepID=A0A437RSG1_9BURK|nr:maltose ABC transporter permease MalF [Rubrivivax rivuli]RVU49685.1 maltose ABC transporter permease MalF [Rubrivivax rivuli]
MSRAPASSLARWLGPAIATLAALGLLWFVFSLWAAAQPLAAVGVLALGGTALVVYGTATSVAWKYLFPGVAGILVFVAFPLVYTVQIGFTNYSSSNLLDFERSQTYLMEQSVVDERQAYSYTLHSEGSQHRLRLLPPEQADGTRGPALVTPLLALEGSAPAGPVLLQPQGDLKLGPALDLRGLIAHRPGLMGLQLQVPGVSAPLRYAGLREFGVIQPLWQAGPDGSLKQLATGTVFKPNFETGFFESAAGERMPPGFKVGIGFANYTRMLLDADFRGPFVSIFIWTVLFAGLTVLFSTALGMTLAVMLEWQNLKYRALYRTLLFLPYAVPGFISILVFKGLFNQNFGEINAILDALFGIRPAWFADPLLAKAMILVVNTWLGYPYIMILCSGLIKAIPSDLYEASAIAGAGPLTNFFKITAPLIAKPLTPLLISAFAFNFNNFVLISLLTDGRPDFLNTKLPAGTTDILVSYTYRIAFTDSGQNFGLAAAISTLIFVMVAVMALVQLRITQRTENKR